MRNLSQEKSKGQLYVETTLSIFPRNFNIIAALSESKTLLGFSYGFCGSECSLKHRELGKFSNFWFRLTRIDKTILN